MTIYYLYIKTHKITGLKYLGQTSASDPHKYPGSGVDWKNHLKEHGYNYTTEILRECQSKDERREWGLYYSNLWNVVESEEWANRIPETGGGGNITPEGCAKAVNTRKQKGSYKRNESAIAKGLETRLLKYGTTNTSTPAGIVKGLETKKRNGTSGNNLTPERIAKCLETKKKNGTMNSNTPESIAKGLNTKTINRNTPNSPTVISKALETRRRNGTMNTSTPESIAKRTETRKKRIQEGTDGVIMKVVCPHCNKEGGQSIMAL